MDTKYLVTKNILFNFDGQFFLYFLSFAETPLIIFYLGLDLFGVLAVVTAVLGYFSILDLGLGLSVIKYISEYSAKKDKRTLEKIIGTSLTLYIFLGFIGGAVIFLLSEFIVSRFLNIPENLTALSITVFYISALGFFVNMLLTVFNAIPSALQRMDISNLRNMCVGLLNTLGTIVLLFFGYGLKEVVTLYIFVSLFVTAILLSDLNKLLPGIKMRLRFDRKIFLVLFKFSGYKFIGNIGGQIVFHLDKLILGFFHPISLVTFYTVPSTLVQKGFSLMLNITNGVFPALSQSFSTGDNKRSRDLYFKMGKFIFFVITPMMFFVFLFADSILLFWVGPEFANKSTTTLRILAIAYFFASLSAPGVIASDASGKPQLPALFSCISAVINLSAAFLLIPRFGIEGAAAALLINFVSQVPVFIYIVNKSLMKVSNLDFFKSSIFKPVTSGIVSTIICSLLNLFMLPPVIKLTSGFILFTLSFIATNLVLKTFEKNELIFLRYSLRKLGRGKFK